MKYLLTLSLLMLTSCEQQWSSIIVKHGHVYKWQPYEQGHFIHDPLCPECKESK